MIDPFAKYQPASREYLSGDFAVVRYRFDSGWVSLNKYSDQEMNRELSLVYRLYDYQCNDFYKHYKDHSGTAKKFRLPQTFKGVFESWSGTDMNGVENRRRTFKRNPYWHYAQPIEQETIANGVSTLNIVLAQFGVDTSTTPPWTRTDE